MVATAVSGGAPSLRLAHAVNPRRNFLLAVVLILFFFGNEKTVTVCGVCNFEAWCQLALSRAVGGDKFN